MGVQKDSSLLNSGVSPCVPSILEKIKTALVAAFSPLVCEVINESHMHSRGSETHYKVVVVSDAFDSLGLVKRHQLVYAALGDIMGQIHALAIHAYTSCEWSKVDSVHESPTCLGGSKFDH